jgi:exonuclease III
MNYINDNSIILGDFNEPSHLDWNDKAFGNKSVPAVVEWKISSFLYNNGFIDLIRFKYNCNIKYPMYTCDILRKETIINPPCRIDFIYTNIKFKELTNVYNIYSYLSDHLPIVAQLLL